MVLSFPAESDRLTHVKGCVAQIRDTSTTEDDTIQLNLWDKKPLITNAEEQKLAIHTGTLENSSTLYNHFIASQTFPRTLKHRVAKTLLIISSKQAHDFSCSCKHMEVELHYYIK